MAILHLVQFTFRQEVPADTRQQLLKEFFELPSKCKDASQNLYLKGIRAGSECSDTTNCNRTHLFVLEFDLIEQREYYKSVDPVHADFAARIIPLINIGQLTAFQEIEF